MPELKTETGQDTSAGDGKNTDQNSGDNQGQTQGASSETKPGENSGEQKTQQQLEEERKKTEDEEAAKSKKLFSQADVERIIKDRLDRAEREKVKEVERQKREAEIAEMKAKGEFEALLKLEQQKTEELQKTLKDQERSVWKAQAAAKFKLNEDLQERLIGETEEELLRDAETLSKMFKTAGKPELEGGQRGAKATENAKVATLTTLKQQHRYTGL